MFCILRIFVGIKLNVRIIMSDVPRFNFVYYRTSLIIRMYENKLGSMLVNKLYKLYTTTRFDLLLELLFG